jgi:hypothetical protein
MARVTVFLKLWESGAKLSRDRAFRWQGRAHVTAKAQV